MERRAEIINNLNDRVLHEHCKFCDFISGGIDEKRIVYQDDLILAFTEMSPMAAFHILLIPKIHIASASEIVAGNSQYIGRVYEAAAKIAAQKNINSYSLFTRSGKESGQTIYHLHHHMISNFQRICVLKI